MGCFQDAYAALVRDPVSPLAEWYPREWYIDTLGKRYLAQGIALLPFLDFDGLVQAVAPLVTTLTPEEQGRNQRRDPEVMTQSAALTSLGGMCSMLHV